MARPSQITQVVRQDRNGNPVTVADQIVASVAAGNYFEQACAAVGIGKTTGYRWLREGALAARRLEQSRTRKAAKLTRNQEACLEFWHAVVEAEARWEVTAVTTLESLARGGVTKTTTTVRRDPQGKTLEETTRTETLPPDPRVIEWRLERKFPERYGRRVEVSTTVPDPLTRDDRAESVAEILEAYLQGREDQESETASGTVSDGD